MNLPDEVAKAKKIEATAATDLSAARAAVSADLSGIEKAWAASKISVITVLLIGLFLGFAIGRFSAHL